jgi:hypothetical protein
MAAPSLVTSSSSTEHLASIRKAMISVYCSLFGGLLIVGLYLSFISSDVAIKNIGPSIHLILLAGILNILSSFSVKIKLDWYFIPASLVLFLILTIVPLRIYLTGGFFSSMPAFGACSILLAGIFYNSKGIIATTLYWIIFTVYLYFQHSANNLINHSSELIYYSALSENIAMLTVTIVCLVFILTQQTFLKKIKELERENLIQKLSSISSNELKVHLISAHKKVQQHDSHQQFNLNDFKSILKDLNNLDHSIKEIQNLEGDLEAIKEKWI